MVKQERELLGLNGGTFTAPSVFQESSSPLGADQAPAPHEGAG